jgi:hypothetical protein
VTKETLDLLLFCIFLLNGGLQGRNTKRFDDDVMGSLEGHLLNYFGRHQQKRTKLSFETLKYQLLFDIIKNVKINSY